MEQGQEKRLQHRVEAAVPILIRGLDTSGHEFEDSTTALEVSRRGFSFLTPRNLEVFAALTVVLPGRGPARPYEGPSDFFAEATVVRIVKEDGNLYRVGVRFMGATLPMWTSENQ
ncbi:MAG TPA: PilZ domain-containing protein [Terriglobia bacterium]|nr:PilZ domain-containing protein [Terriglobia bacterium]